MYFFIAQSVSLKSKAESVELDFQEIYVSAMQEMQKEYSLPAVHEWGDGYTQGDASIEEIFDLVSNINSIEGGDEPSVYANLNEDDATILTDIYEYLDKKLISKIEDSIESQIK